MIRNYLLVTFRNLYKNRISAVINVLGLGLALSICIVATILSMIGLYTLISLSILLQSGHVQIRSENYEMEKILTKK